MKLSLSSEKNVDILVVQGPLVEHDTQVLRAGIQKLLKSGKNRIIMELPAPENDELPSEVLRELAKFDMVARELAGRIVLAQVSPILKSKIEVFAKPPVILCFESRAKALEFFSTPPPSDLPPEPSADSARPSEADPRFQELSSLKAQSEMLAQKVSTLEQQVIEMTLKRREPPNEAAYLERIQTLESKIESLLAVPAASPTTPPVPTAPPKGVPKP